jgi:hypothetical protein
MTTERNNRDDQCNHVKANGEDSFEEHNNCMKAFRRSHGDVTMVNGRRCNKLSILEITQPLHLPRMITQIDTGGTKHDIDDWWVLVDALQVAEHKLSQN